MLNNKKLKTARLAAGFSQDQTIRHLCSNGFEITKAALSYYENGKRTPGASVVRELAHIYGTSPSSFFKEEQPVQIDWYSYRASISRLGKREREEIQAFSEQKADRLMEIYNLVPSFRADFPKRKVVRTFDDADMVAEQLRQQWKIGIDAIESITQCFENHGALLLHYNNERTSAFDGLSAFVNKQFPLLIINSNVPVDRLRFDLAHELGHVLMDTSLLDDNKTEEKLAHRFASSFLVPPAIVIKELGNNRKNITLGELLLLKEKYGMSVSAWTYSAYTHGIITKSLFEQLFMEISRRGWRKKEPEVYKGNEIPARLQQTVLRLVAENVISAQRAIELFPDMTEILVNEGFSITSEPNKLRRMPLKKRSRILEKAAEKAVEAYTNDKSLTGFEENDFYEYK
jgi:Zn-dependent peptidase ImmA (M78 family)